MNGLDGNGLQVVPVYFGEIAKNRFIVSSSLEKSVDIFLPMLYEQFQVRKKVLNVKYLSSFDEHTTKSL